jgi:hypothetical protein
VIQLTNLTDDPIQQLQVALADGSLVTLTLTYRAATQRWTFDLIHTSMPPNGALNGRNLCVHPNILRQWRRIIPFGLSVTSSDNGDPVTLEDFVNGRITLFILDNSAGNTDVEQVEQNIFGAGLVVT